MGSDQGPDELVTGFFAGVPDYTARLLASITPITGGSGSFDQEAFDPVAFEIGADGFTGAVLISWALVLSGAYPAGARALEPVLAEVPEQYRGAVDEHGHRLLEVAREVGGTSEAIPVLIRTFADSSEAVADLAVYWLLRVMTMIVHPVLCSLGGFGRWTQVTALVGTRTQPLYELLPVRDAEGHAVCALSAFSAGNIRQARMILSFLRPSQVLLMVLPVAAEVLRGPHEVGLVVDEHGVPEAVIDAAAEPTLAWIRGMLDAITAGDHARISEFATELREADETELAPAAGQLAASVGYRLGQLLTAPARN
ncbi:hypothetical protein [Amycolatopsis minnesotensis]|uniref:Uncharacterized protein n=1 Tax=Amycolatopsis minnesotensis TaxID=337894 RepID=A0ABN2S9L1_9PSEU